MLGLLICLIGIGLSGKAGMMKESELSEEEQKKSIEEFSLVKGLIIAILSGILSSFFNFGIEAGKPLTDAAVAAGYNPLYQNNVTLIVILWGGLTSNFAWTTILSLRNKSYHDFVNKSTPITRNILFSALAGTTWFLQFFFYGMGESKLGNGASSWILHMSAIILTAKYMGNLPSGMERCNPENEMDDRRRHCRHYIISIPGWDWQFNVKNERYE